ncbi:MAG: YbhB/YbcL family Raf kinase inhibitor-like protein [Planctomycetes bacterium]|nr:YbhB/YbcL family Raf kinase inhibitor-like protein [Planctomycetota bacterium]
MSITVESTAFMAGEKIPAKFTGEGDDVSPALRWKGAPAGAKEFALICDDPDAPRAEPWVHWVAWSIPADAQELPESASRSLKNLKEGENDFGNPGYNGPMPPKGHGVHHYRFKLYALKEALDLKPGASCSELLAAMKGKILAQGELIGAYERK